jgi:hypothetical protein
MRGWNMTAKLYSNVASDYAEERLRDLRERCPERRFFVGAPGPSPELVMTTEKWIEQGFVGIWEEEGADEITAEQLR